MTTRHLSIRVTLYGDRTWLLELLETACERGKPARSEGLVVQVVPEDEVKPRVLQALRFLMEKAGQE